MQQVQLESEEDVNQSREASHQLSSGSNTHTDRFKRLSLTADLHKTIRKTTASTVRK